MGSCLTKFQISDWIAVVNLLTTTGIGLWLACVVQRNLAVNRSLKDYYIQEVRDLRKAYVDYLNVVYSGKHSAKKMKEWFKIMSNRIECLEKSIQSSFTIDDSSILRIHSELRNYITNTDDYNEGYSSEKIIFSETTKTELLKHHTKLLNCFMDVVVSVNSSKRKKTRRTDLLT